MSAQKASLKDIQRDVQEVRSEITHTLGEIQHRISPGQLLDQAIHYLGDSSREGMGIGRLISRNPLPVTLIGVGAAWLAVSSSSSRQPGRRDPRSAETLPSWPLPQVEEDTLMAVSRENLVEWLRDARAMEDLSVETLEKQVLELDAYPQLQAGLRQHLADSRRQRERLNDCVQRLGTAEPAGDGRADKLPGEEQFAALLGDGTVIKNGITGFAFEHFEIATYRTLIEAASEAGEHQVARVCRENLREEEEMAAWLARRMRDVTRQYLYHEASQRSGAAEAEAGTLRR